MFNTLKSTFVTAQFVRFLAVGGLAALLQWSSRFIFDFYCSYSTSVLLAYGVGLTSGFLLNRSFVFQSSQADKRLQLLYFILINLAGLPMVWWLSIFLGLRLFPRFIDPILAEALGNAIAIASPVALNFILHKFVTFRVPKL